MPPARAFSKQSWRSLSVGMFWHWFSGRVDGAVLPAGRLATEGGAELVPAELVLDELVVDGWPQETPSTAITAVAAAARVRGWRFMVGPFAEAPRAAAGGGPSNRRASG